MNDRLGPDIFSTLRMKGHVLHRTRAYLKVPGWSFVWNALLTKKLPMFLPGLNESSGDCENILPVSGSYWSNMEFFRMVSFTAWLRGWNVRVNGILSLFSFCDVCSADCRSISWARWWPAWKQKQDSHVCRRNRTFPLILRKNPNLHYKDDELLETENKEWYSWHVMNVKMNTTNNYENLWVCSARWCISRWLVRLKKYRKFHRYIWEQDETNWQQL